MSKDEQKYMKNQAKAQEIAQKYAILDEKLEEKRAKNRQRVKKHNDFEHSEDKFTRFSKRKYTFHSSIFINYTSIVAETDLAIRFKLESGEEVWLPKSKMKVNFHQKLIEVITYIAASRGLIPLALFRDRR